MKTCPKMRAFCNQIAAKHEFNLSDPNSDNWGNVLKIENEPFMPLCLTQLGRYLVAVYHYYRDPYGDKVYDPEVVFFTGYPEWVPYSIQEPTPRGTLYKEVAVLSPNGLKIEKANLAAMNDIGTFVEGLWVKNLKSQGFLEVEPE